MLFLYIFGGVIGYVVAGITVVGYVDDHPAGARTDEILGWSLMWPIILAMTIAIKIVDPKTLPALRKIVKPIWNGLKNSVKTAIYLPYSAGRYLKGKPQPQLPKALAKEIK